MNVQELRSAARILPYLFAIEVIGLGLAFWQVGMVKLPTGGSYYIGVTPLSMVYLGIALVLLFHKYAWKGIGLWIMVCGAYDFFAALGFRFLLGEWSDNLFAFQTVIMIAGWGVAGAPVLRLNWYVLLPIVTLALAMFVPILHGPIMNYGIYEIGLWAYVYQSVGDSLFSKLAKR